MSDKPTTGDRQKVRALALVAAATASPIESMDVSTYDDPLHTVDNDAAFRARVDQFMHFIEHGRWPQ